MSGEEAMMADGSEAYVGKNRGVTKVERYRWAEAGKPGELVWVSPHEIRFDEAYQRGVNTTKVQEIASKFSWPAFGVVSIVQRADGTLWGFDGMHRTMAARRRADVKLVPAVKFQMTKTAEAQAFLDCNTLRRNPHAHEKFKAEVETKRPAALVVAELIAAANRNATSGQSVRSVNCLRLLTLLAERDEALLRKVWPLITELCEGAPLLVLHVEPIMYLEQYGTEPITSPRWSKRLLALGHAGVVEACRKAAAFYVRGGAKVWAQGILNALNKNLQESRQLALREPIAATPAGKANDEG